MLDQAGALRAKCRQAVAKLDTFTQSLFGETFGEYIQRHIAQLNGNRTILEPEFLAIVLESLFVRRQADRLVRGIAQKTLNLSDLRSFDVIAPFLERPTFVLESRKKVTHSNRAHGILRRPNRATAL